jgi:transcriptional regulator with XRE-family HTH domain
MKMPDAVSDPQFGARMRELMEAHGVSFRGLAARTFHGKSYLQEIAAGKKQPTVDTARRIDAALRAGGELAALVGGPPCWPLADGGDWRQRDNESLAGALLAERPGPGNARRLAHEWLVAEPPQVYELRSGRRIGGGAVQKIEERVHQLRLLDDHIGGSQTHAVLIAELHATANLLREAAYTGHVGRRLLVAIADLCQIAGFVAADAGRHAEARHLHMAGMRAAHAGGDAESAANNLSSVSYIAANVGDPTEAVLLARSAYVGVRRTARPIVRALLLERLAWAHARASEAEAAGRALGAVEDSYRSGQAPDDPPWTYWLTADEVEIMAGRVWTELHRPLRAVPILERATARYGNDVPRETALYRTWLAEALTQAGEVEAAADTAIRALALASRAGSARTLERIAEIRALLAAYADTAAVAAFEDALRSAEAEGLALGGADA